MSNDAPNIYPFMRYEDASGALRFLEKAFGFTPGLVVPGPNGSIAHAEMHLGPGHVMLGSVERPNGDGGDLRSPRELGGTSGGICVYIQEIDAHYARAIAGGAEILRPIRDEEYGARGYLARDPEGYIWSFSNYRPAPPQKA